MLQVLCVCTHVHMCICVIRQLGSCLSALSLSLFLLLLLPGGLYLLSKVPTLCLKAQLKQYLLLKPLLSSLPRAPKVILPQVHDVMVVGPVGVHPGCLMHL